MKTLPLVAVAAGFLSVIAASCGKSPANPLSHPSVSKAGAKPALKSRTAAACPAWVRADVRVGAAAALPVPTTRLLEFDGIGSVNAATLAVWLGQKPVTPLRNVLRGWSWSRHRASRGDVTVTLHTSRTGDSLYLDEPHPTPWQIHMITKAGWPAPPTVQPFRLRFAINPGPSTVHDALRTLVQDAKAHGNGVVISDVSLEPGPAPAGYQTNFGYFALNQVDKPSQCLPAATVAPALGPKQALIAKSYWTVFNANGISVGFAPGYVVITSARDGMITTLWYREPSIRVPLLPAAAN